MAAANDVKRYPGALPGANEEQMDEIRDKLFASVTKHISEGPTFQGLQFDEQVGGNLEGWDTRPISTARTEMPESSTSAWDTRPIVSEKAEPKEDSNYQRMIYGLERGSASLAQTISLSQSEALRNELNYLEKYKDEAQDYANRAGPNYGLERNRDTGNVDVEQYKTALRKRLEEYYKAQDIRRTAISGIPVSDSLKRVAEAETWGEAWKAYREDFLGTTLEVFAESLPNMAPGLVAGALAGPIVAAPLLGLSSYTAESGGEIEGALQEIAQKKGLDLNTVEGQQAVVDSPEFQKLVSKAQSGAAVVGLMDTLAGFLPAVKLVKGKPVREFFLQLAGQMAAGGGGEAGKQLVQEGEIRSPGSVLLEMGAETVSGPIEIYSLRKEILNERQKKLEDEASDSTRKSKYSDPESGGGGGEAVLRQVEDEARSYEVPEQGFGEAERVAIENTLDQQTGGGEQGALDLKPQEPAPAQEALPVAPQEQPVPQEPQEVVQTPLPPNEPATTAPAEQAPTDEVVSYDDLQTEPAPVEEAPAPVEEAPAPVESPMVSAKELAEGIRNLNKKNKEALPGIRKAMQVVRRALVNRFGEENIPKLANAAGAPAIGKFFESVDESVDGVQDLLPNLKEFLQAVVASPDAAGAIQNLERLAGYINSSVQSLPTDTTQGFLSQVNEAVSLFDSFESERKSKTRKVTVKDKATGETRKEERPSSRKGFRLKDRIVQVDELATTVEQMLEHASDIGAQGVEGQDQVKGRIRQARSWRNQADRATQRVLKGGKGTVVEVLHATGAKLDEAQAILRKAANDLAVSIAEREGRAAEARAQRKQPQEKVNKEQTKSEAVEKPTETKDLEASTNDIKLNKQSVNKPKKESKKNKDLEKGKKSDVIKTDTTEETAERPAARLAKEIEEQKKRTTKDDLRERRNKKVISEVREQRIKEATKETAAQKRTAADVSQEGAAPLNPKVEKLVKFLNKAGIRTTMSGDFNGSPLVYVDIEPENPITHSWEFDLLRLLPPGWKVSSILHAQTAAQYGINIQGQTLDPAEVEYTLSDDYVEQAKELEGNRPNRSKEANARAVELIDASQRGERIRLSKRGDAVTQEEAEAIALAIKTIAIRQNANKPDPAEIKASKLALRKQERGLIKEFLEDLKTETLGYVTAIVTGMHVNLDYATVAELKTIAKAFGVTKFSSLPKRGLIDAIEQRADAVQKEREAESMAEEDAEIQATVEQYVPSKFRKGHVFHTVRNISDVASIVKDGLKRGTNLALDIMGQGVSMLGDAGTVVLVFPAKKGDYTVKTYQQDGVAKGGMKPIAIVADELTAGELATLAATGIPVYVNGSLIGQQETKTEKGIANDLNSLVEDANKVEELGGIESYEGGQGAYNLAGKLTSGQVTKADLKNLSMAQLRAIAKAVAAKPAPSKDVTIDRILAAADKEVTRVEAELAQMSQEAKAEEQAQEQAKQPKEKPQEIDVAPPDDLVEIDVKPAARGKVASKVKAALGYGDEVDLSEALANEGIDQNALNVFTSLVKSLPEKAQAQVFDALQRLVSQPDQGMGLLNFISSVEDAVGGTLSPTNRMTLVEFATAMQEKSLMADAGMDARTELLHRRAEEEGRSPEDVLEIEKATQANYVFDEDTIDDIEGDEFYEAFKRDTWQELDFMRVRDKFWSTLRNAIHHILRPIRTRQINELRNTLWNIPGLAGDRSMIRKLFARDGRPTEFHRFVNEHMSIGSDLLAEPTTMNEFLDKLIASMPKNHRYYGLAKKLRSLNLDVQFTIWDSHRSVQIINNEWFDDDAITRPISGFHYVDADGFSNAKIAVGFRNYTENDGRLTTADAEDFIHTAMHEMVHAATVQALDTNEAFRNEIYAAMRATVEHMKANNPELYSLWRRDFENKQAGKESYELTESSREFYGMTNMREFVAEALTNPAFQKYLSTVPMPRDALGIREQVIGQVLNERGKAPNVFQYIINSMKQMLGYSIRNTVLESVIFANMVHMSDVETQALTAFEREYESAAYDELREGLKPSRSQRKVSGSAPSVQAANDIVDSQAALKKSVGYKVKEIANILKNFGVKENLAWSNRDVIERKFRDLFGKASEAMGFDGNVLTQMTKALNDASALARKFENKGYAMIKRIRNLSKEVRLEFGVQMRDITSANIDPEFPLDSVQNQHIWRTYERQDQTGPLDPKTGKPVKRPYKRDIPKDVKEKAVEARANYLRFKAENPIAARLLRDMAKLSKDIHNAKVSAAMYALGESFGFDNVTVNKMQAAKTAEDIDAIFPKDEVEKAQAKLEAMQMENVLVKPTKEEVKAAKKIISQAEARSMAASSAKKILHESSIKGWYFPLRRYGNYVVSTPPDTPKKDQFVSFHMTELDAKREAAALRKAGYDVSVSTKIEGRAIPRDVKTVAGEILKRLPRSPDGEQGIQEGVRARLTSAVNEVLAQSAAYQSQLKRANVAGVSPMDMARGYEEYVHISKYTIGDLLVSHKVADALKKIYMIQRSPDEAGLTDEEGVVAGHVANELALQDKTSATDRERSKAQEVVGALGFLNFLGAPSYWALNATQTYTITIPYLSAKYGSFKGPRQLIKSQKTVLAAVTRAVGKKKFSYEGFKDELPPDARRIVEQLEAENVIQTTIAHEFGQMLSPTFWNQMRDTAVGSGVAKGASYALQVMEKVPEAVEHYNRISTALATYALSGSMEATIDAVNETQFNYDTANRARRLKYLPGKTGAGRAFVTPIMMFKSYGVGLMRLYYGSVIKALRGQDRAEALRLVGYLTASHVAFGGVAGGIMSAPVVAIIGAANAVFREAGDEWDLEEAAEEVTRELAGDWAAIAVRRGLPAAMGVDLSKSINLGNLIWMSDDRFDPTKPYAWAAKVGELATGPIGAYGYRFAAEGAKVWNGSPDASLWEFAEALVPVKVVRGVSSAFRYRAEGLRTSSDLELIKPEEFSGFLATMLGFQSTQKTSIQERFWDDKAREQRRTKEKSRLIDVATRALDRGNFEAFDDTLRDIAQFNLSVEKPSEGVTPGDMARLRLRRMKAQREFDMEYAEYKEQTR